MITAVPQTYRGIRFRSTLEADWAYNLDMLGINWEYEPEAIQLPSKELYRPDFYLPELTTWLEVKGPHDQRIEKARELAENALHRPDCDELTGAWPWIRFRTWTDSDEMKVAAMAAQLPDGHTQIQIDRFRLQEGRSVERLGSIILKRRVSLSVTDYPRFRGTPTSIKTPDCCGYGWSSPWQLIVIGRPAIRGGLAFEAGIEGHDITIIRCSNCEQYSFFEESGIWQCRKCQAGGKVYAGGAWRSGEIQARKAPRERR